MNRINGIKAFLFGESQLASALEVLDDDIAELFSEAEADELKINKAPLAAALKAAGVNVELSVEQEPVLNLSSSEEYASVISALQSAETLAKLAELGWVAVGTGDTKISFIEIDTATTGDGDPANGSSTGSEAETYDAILKGAIEFATSPDYDLPKADENPGFKPGKVSLGKQTDGKVPKAKAEAVDDDGLSQVLDRLVSESGLKSKLAPKLTPDVKPRGHRSRGKMRKAMNRHHNQ